MLGRERHGATQHGKLFHTFKFSPHWKQILPASRAKHFSRAIREISILGHFIRNIVKLFQFILSHHAIKMPYICRAMRGRFKASNLNADKVRRIRFSREFSFNKSRTNSLVSL